MADTDLKRAAALAADLEDACPGTREEALEKLKALYVRCEAGSCTLVPVVAGVALPYAHRALAHPEPGVRIAGLCAVALFAPDAEASIPLLAAALADADAAVRLTAIEALGEFGASAASVAGSVAERLAHAPTPEERSAAAHVLAGYRGGQIDHLDALLHALLHDAPAVQAGAAFALSNALEDERECVRERVSQALHGLTRRAR
jgi:HEAT repeat protein